MENETLDGDNGQPTQTSSNQGSETSAIDYDALAKALEPTLAKMVERQTQSTKDKRIAKLQGAVNGFETQLAEFEQLTKGGLSRDVAMRLMNLQNPRETDEVELEPVSQQSSAGKQDNVASSVDSDTLEAIGLDPNSPEVTNLLRRNASLEDYVGLVVKSKKAKPTPQPGGVMPSPGQSSPNFSEELDEITEQLNRLYQNPRSNQKQINELLGKQSQLLKR